MAIGTLNMKRAGIGAGLAIVVAVGLISTMGQMIPGGGYTVTTQTRCSPGERPEWDGSVWQCGARPLKWVSGNYYFVPNGPTTAANSTLGVGSLRCVPEVVPNTAIITRLGAEITAAGDAGSKYRLGIYSDTDRNGQPDTLVLDAGTINGDSATVQEITGLSTTVNPAATPTLWFCGAVQGVTVTQPTVRVHSGYALSPLTIGTSAPSANQVVVGYVYGGITSTLPTTLPTAGTSTVAPRLFAKF